MRPVPGNHEYLTAGASGYFTFFGAAAGDPAKGYYSYDIGATFDAFWSALVAAGAEIVLSGHDDDYERFAPMNASGQADANGVRQFVVGTGGAERTSVNTPRANSQVLNNNSHGVLALTLHPNGYDWDFVPEAGATFPDSGSAACH